MVSGTLDNPPEVIGDPVLVNAVQKAVHDSLTMAGLSLRCVGVSTIPSRDPGKITGLIGVHGDVTGYITVNVSEVLAVEIVSAMLMEQFAAVDHQVIDGVGELTNMVAGGIKKWLLGTPWAFSDVTVPSVIVGQNYDIAFAQGFRFLALTFEHAQCKSIMVQDRLLCAAVSLFRV